MAGDDRIAKLTSDLVSAYLAKLTSPLSPSELIKLVNEVRSGLEGKEAAARPAEAAPLHNEAESEIENQVENAVDSMTNLTGDVATRKRRRPLRDPKKDGPMVPISKSVMPNYVVCLEDGKRLKTLKSHLRVYFNLTPEEYKERWNLPEDYPVTAPLYSEMRKRQVQQRMERQRSEQRRQGAQ